jgi:hypothetical protein
MGEVCIIAGCARYRETFYSLITWAQPLSTRRSAPKHKLRERSHLTSSSSRRDRRLEKGRLALTTVTQRSLAVPDGMQKCSGVPLAWLNVAYLILTSPEQFFVLKRVLTEVQMRL